LLRAAKGTAKTYTKGRKEDMCNPPKIKGDAEEKYLSL
jgi:hypothetical protein